MGFSTNLQGKLAHEALLTRQDAELRLLESMKRCIVLKVKCDKDYATALTSVATQGLKFDRGEELIGKWQGFPLKMYVNKLVFSCTCKQRLQI